ncbi:MAG: flagellar protein FlaF [Rhodobacteraceae bacterium HLUCCA24]|nr:MAG: flagellar protein FlaF [Rhodobacteraceae bacterium HLUCCA24]
MNAQHLARAGYAAPAAPTRTARGVEYDAFVRVTRQLRAAAETSTKLPRHRQIRLLADALHANRRLWTTLTADLAGDGNALPEALRAQLISLGEFARVHASRVLDGRGSVDPLIAMNTAVMRGLRGDAGGAQQP